jgi:hypothetical protein
MVQCLTAPSGYRQLNVHVAEEDADKESSRDQAQQLQGLPMGAAGLAARDPLPFQEVGEQRELQMGASKNYGLEVRLAAECKAKDAKVG